MFHDDIFGESPAGIRKTVSLLFFCIVVSLIFFVEFILNM